MRPTAGRSPATNKDLKMPYESRPIGPQDFTNYEDRHVLTEAGAPGMDGRAGYGSTADIGLASIASIIYVHAKHLNDDQLDDIVRWVDMYKTR